MFMPVRASLKHRAEWFVFAADSGYVVLTFFQSKWVAGTN
jgi:hypothetical protein